MIPVDEFLKEPEEAKPTEELPAQPVDFEKGALEQEIRELKQRIADLETELAYKQENESLEEQPT